MRKIAILALLLVSGCSWFSKGDAHFSCPRTGFINYADKLVEPGIEAVFTGYTGTCKPADNAVALDLTLPLHVQKVGEYAPEKVTLPYFVAVLSPDEEVLQRQSFTSEIKIDPETGVGDGSEDHTITVPLPQGAQAYRYKIAFGFELTPEQLNSNKEKKK